MPEPEKKNEAWKGVILGILISILVVVLVRVHQVGMKGTDAPARDLLKEVDEYAAKRGIRYSNVQPPAKVASPQAKSWFAVHKYTMLDENFDVSRWQGYRFTVPPATVRPDLRFEVNGVYASDRPVVLAIMNDANMDRLKAGYPPLVLRQFSQGQIDFPRPQQDFWMVFYQLPQQQATASIPTNEIELGLYLLKALRQISPVASHVTAEFYQTLSLYSDRTTAEALHDKLENPSPSQHTLGHMITLPNLQGSGSTR